MNKISIGLTGDFCPWLRMEDAYFSNTWRKALEPAKEILEQNDFNIIDLECPLTTGNSKLKKTGPHIKSKPQTAELLKYLNCEQVVTANNHFKDYGWDGMKETYEALKSQGITWLGSGENIEKASKPIILEKDDIKIAVFNMTEYEWSIASRNEPGCNPIDYPRALKDIQEVRQKGIDFVLVILHGGHEHYELPSPRMKSQFRFMVDAGADAVVGHHIHIISGYEVYKNKPIFYSLGNFCFDWPGQRNSTWNKGLILKLIFEKNKHPEFDFTFVMQNDTSAGINIMNELESNKYLSKISEINNIIEDDNLLNEHFDEYINKKKEIMLSSIQPYRNKWLVALHKRGFLPDIMRKNKKKYLQVLAQCESHREILINSLNKANL